MLPSLQPLSLLPGTLQPGPLQGAPAGAEPGGVGLGSLFDMILDGGPMMLPIGICSVIVLAYTVERFLTLNSSSLGSNSYAKDLIEAARTGGIAGALAHMEANPNSMARTLSAGLKRRGCSRAEVEKAVEDAGGREVRRLSAGLRPLVVVGMIAPLLGLLGTVWGMIEAFSSIAGQDGLGKPELLAGGISQALITTAAGLAVAIPAQALYYFFRARVDRFVQRTEDTFADLGETFSGTSGDREWAA